MKILKLTKSKKKKIAEFFEAVKCANTSIHFYILQISLIH